ncbi:MAG: 30S ribosomal protein S16 [Patescibacteria group bacterium]|jgi:small subunit ribosomal protein S16
MALSVRLSLVGKKNRPVYRIVVAETRSKRNGKSLQQIGVYDPNVNPPVLQLDNKALESWVKKGAIVSTGLDKLLKKESEIKK